MAIFTAIATAIVGAIGLTGVVATIATGVIATGLGFATAKLLGITDRPSAAQQRDPGVKIQLPPGTDNKVPRYYGRNYSGGIIIDAAISNQNKTMTYAIVISEYNTSDSWSINKIYRGDAELVFGSAGSGHIVQNVIDPNTTTNTTVTGKMRCRVYAGGSGSADQVFPNPSTSTPANAYDMFPGWTSSNTMDGLVFAIFEIDYDSENGLTGLDAITFDINNALTEPSNVLLDYLQNDRYGANINISLIDTDTFNSWNTFATANVSYFDTVANATLTHQRYQIDGALSTFDSTKTNINKICQAGGAFFTYNNKSGKFAVVANKLASNAELANAFIFSDDNIISQIKISSTDLFNLYNQVEVEYPSVIQRDQTDTVFIEVTGALLHPNEPENVLSYRLDMVNDRSRVSELANIDLKQSRINTILEFTADYSAMQVDVGDVVKVNNTPFGYTDKLFRVMRTTEVEDTDGMLSVNLILLEYDEYIYEDIEYSSDAPVDTSGISNWVFINSNAEPIIGNVTVSDNPLGGEGNANIFYSANATFIANVDIDTFIADNNVSYANATPFFSFDITVPSNVTVNKAVVNIVNTATANSNVQNTVTEVVWPPAGSSFFDANASIKVTRPLNNYVAGGSAPTTQYLEFDVRMENTSEGITTQTTSTAAIPVNVQNTVPPTQLAPLAGGQFIINSPPDVYDSSPSPNFANLMVSPDIYTLTTGAIGEHYVMAACDIQGDYTPADQPLTTGLGIKIDVEYANSAVQTVFNKENLAVQESVITPFVGGKFTIPSGSTPVEMRIMMRGASDVPTAEPLTGERGWYRIYYQVIKPNKGVV